MNREGNQYFNQTLLALKHKIKLKNG